MTELLKKSILFAIGAATLIHEKGERLIKLVITKKSVDTDQKQDSCT